MILFHSHSAAGQILPLAIMPESWASHRKLVWQLQHPKPNCKWMLCSNPSLPIPYLAPWPRADPTNLSLEIIKGDTFSAFVLASDSREFGGLDRSEKNENFSQLVGNHSVEIGRQWEKVREKVRVGPFPARGGTHHVLAGALTPLTSLRDGRSRSDQILIEE